MGWPAADAPIPEDDFPGLPQTGGGSVAPSALAWFQAASPILSKVAGGNPAGPSRVDSANSFTFDNSGFVVDFGPGNATSSKTAGVPSWLIAAAVGAAALAGIVWIKKKA